MAEPTLSAATARAWLLRAADEVTAARDQLTALDSAIGDADHGVNLARGFAAVRESMDDEETAPGKVLITAGRTLISKVGGASGPLYGSALRAMGKALDGAEPVDPRASDAAALGAALRAALDAIVRLGGAQPGDKTMVDAWTPAVAAYDDAAAADPAASDPAVAARAAAEAARHGAEATIPLVAHKGRASYLGERSAGHQDPGATSTAMLLTVLADVLEAAGSDPS
jgi:dihydroxyacetone kinase-like protein